MSQELNDLAKKLLANGKIASPEALEIIRNRNLFDEVLKLEETIIKKSTLESLEKEKFKNEQKIEKESEKELKQETKLEEKPEEPKKEEVEIRRDRKKKVAEEHDVDFNIYNSEVKHVERKTSDFINYFNSRYELIQGMLMKRVNPISISNVKKTRNDEVSIIGMVYDIKTTASNNKIIELEDPTGKLSAMITQNSEGSLFEESENILKDEVLGVRGVFKNNYLFIRELIRPEIPITKEIKKLDVPLSCVFISDLHVGSVDFLEDTFKKFLKWLHSKEAENVKYILIAGDLVDGIGIYASQEEDLSIKSGKKQYEHTAELLKQIPEHIKIIVQPGNHDIVGNHEPQNTLKDTALSQLPNIVFGTNPCWVTLDKIKILMYHGYSYDNLIRELPSIRQKGYREPTLPMIEALKRRHLAPTYGSSLAIPEQKDYLVVEDIPDILHSGHLHTVGMDNYKNVLTINSGTFQGRTKFQEMLGHVPHPGIFVKVDMDTRKSRMVNLNNY